MSEAHAPARKAHTEIRELPKGLIFRSLGCTAAAILLGAAIFAFDLSTPLGVAGGVPYVTLILLAPLFRRRGYIPALAVAASVLTVAGYLLSPQGGTLWMVLTNRAIALFVIWVTAYAVYQWGLYKGKLQLSREGFRDLYDNAPDMYLSLDAGTSRILDCNKTFAANLGYSKHETIGRPIHDFYQEDCHKEAGRCFEAFVTHGSAESDDLRLKRKDGSTIEVNLRTSAVRDLNGDILRSRSVLRDITDKKMTEREAVANSVLLQATLASMAQGFTAYDAENRLIAFNDKTNDFFGYPPGFLKVGMPHEAIIRFRVERGFYGDGDPEELTKRLVLRSQNPSERTREVQSARGRTHVYHRRPMPNGAFVTTFTDITEQKEAEREALAETAYLEAIFAAGATAFSIFDTDYNLIRYNEQYERLFGYPKGFLRPDLSLEELTRCRHQLGQFGDRDVEEVIRGRRERASGEFSGERTLPDGTSYVFHRKALAGGGYVTSFTDVADLKQARHEVEQKSVLLDTALQIMAQGFAVYDSNQKVVTYNEKFIEMSGLPNGCQPLGMSHEEILRLRAKEGKTDERLTEEVIQRRVKNALNALSSVREHVQDDGTAFLFHRLPLPGGGYVVTYTDITEQKQAEEKLHQAQKMEVIGQLTGGVAHDFNNLLAVIMGNAELLLDERGQGDEKVTAMLRAARRGSELTQRLLSFSRRQPLFPRSIDLSALIDDLRDLLQRTLGETIEISTDVAPGLWQAQADPGQVENALLNLAINARDAMPGGGKLTIACANASLDDDFAAEHNEVAASDYVVLEVGDTGTGMPEDVLAHAFEPFYTTKGVGEGSGLGLSMVYGFAKQSGGHAVIHSEEGKGTTVRLYLPRSGVAERHEAEKPAGDLALGQSETILVIEDDLEVQAMVCSSLESLGFRAIAEATATRAMDILRREKVDLVLSDVVLPDGMSGPAFADQARAMYPDIKIIFMSGYPAAVASETSPLRPQEVLLDKPFLKQELAQAVRVALK